ncbi:MAG: hypothetical protein R2789_15645 [Microthrixaceae bacterium]
MTPPGSCPELRNSQVLVETLEALCVSTPVALGTPALSEARSEAVARHRRATERLAAADGPLARARRASAPAGEIVGQWDLRPTTSLRSEQGSGTPTGAPPRRSAGVSMSEVPGPSTSCASEVKYHRYQLELLSSIGGGLIEPWADRLHDLTDLLGDDHDLWELVAVVRSDPGAFGGEEALDAIEVLAAGRSAAPPQHAGAQVTTHRRGPGRPRGEVGEVVVRCASVRQRNGSHPPGGPRRRHL